MFRVFLLIKDELFQRNQRKGFGQPLRSASLVGLSGSSPTGGPVLYQSPPLLPLVPSEAP